MKALVVQAWEGSGLTDGAARLLPHLEIQEAINNIAVSVLGDVRRGSQAGAVRLACAMGAGGAPMAIGLLTDRKYLLAPTAHLDGIDLLARDICSHHPDVPGWMGPAPEAARFARAWTEQGGGRAEVAMRMGLYQLRAIRQTTPVPGTAGPARADDHAALADWVEAFHREIGFAAPRPADAIVAEHLRTQALWVWRLPGGDAMSMAGCGHPTPHGIRVTLVYTPPPYRGRGYATACVAALSAHLLATRYRYCFLYADSANPTANGVYRRIGYDLVTDVVDYRLP